VYLPVNGSDSELSFYSRRLCLQIMGVLVSTENGRHGGLIEETAPGSSSWPELDNALRRSQDYLLSIQKSEGYWVGELMVDSTLISDTVAYHHCNGKGA